MCGVAGFAGQGNYESLRQLVNEVSHRGPDDHRIETYDNAGFGFSRLAIIDLESGMQPISSKCDKYKIVFNGEIYNYRDLRDELHNLGHSFKTSGDAEVILNGFIEWGVGVFSKLRGMFALAISDQFGNLTMARDPLGKKPLYYCIEDQTLWFCSEFFPLAKLLKEKVSIDESSLVDFLMTDSTPRDSSILKGIKKVLPNHFLTYGVTNQVIQKSYSSFTEYEIPNNPAQIYKNFNEIFEVSLKRRLISEKPIGIFLSSGTDSTFVAAHLREMSFTNFPAFTFSLGESSYDESSVAQKLANELGLESILVDLDMSNPSNLVNEALGSADEPLNDPGFIPMYYLSKTAKQYVDVVLTGDGGDELFLGYQHMFLHEIYDQHPKIMPLMGRIFRTFSPLIPTSDRYFSAGFKIDRFIRGSQELNPFFRDELWRGAFTPHDAASILNKLNSWSNVNTSRSTDIAYLKAQKYDSRQMSEYYFRNYLSNTVLTKVDRATMASGLEARSPLLDLDLINYCLNLPKEYRDGSKTLMKEFIRKSLVKTLPPKQKHGMTIPVASWLRDDLRTELMDLSSAVWLDQQGIFNSKKVREMIDLHLSRKRDFRKELWGFFVFQKWYERWEKC
jgi:asparagine synthase (glutamine-hydrolysing)